ncbi:hypothetical protein F7R14_20945 [Pseudomonas lini]|uniref:Uncharacterized protein n=1 Tax=Pseudomonas lini TaxID=163011 RepID=A0A7V7TKF8_9PSED|nr:hypothetical protein F7R14_20945 [Pseudomonas lini]MDT9676751.1 hypothetical protein [Pseudomonas sp. JV414]
MVRGHSHDFRGVGICHGLSGQADQALICTVHVGAGLLAKAVCQTTSMLTMLPFSRASPLPQRCETDGRCRL